MEGSGGGKGWYHLHKIANLLQHKSKCVQIATLLLLAATKGTISCSLHLHYDCLNERMTEGEAQLLARLLSDLLTN
jgi:hypothetical protein